MTPREFLAMKRQWEAARGIKPPLTAEEQANLEAGRAYILNQKMRAHNREVERRRLSKLTVVERRANG